MIERKEIIRFMGDLRYYYFACFCNRPECKGYTNVRFHYTDIRHQSFILLRI